MAPGGERAQADQAALKKSFQINDLH